MGRETRTSRGRSHGSRSAVVLRQLLARYRAYHFPLCLVLVIGLSLLYALGHSSRYALRRTVPNPDTQRHFRADQYGDDDDKPDDSTHIWEEPPSEEDENEEHDDEEGTGLQDDGIREEEVANEVEVTSDDDAADEQSRFLFPRVDGSGGGAKSIAALLRRRRQNGAEQTPNPARVEDTDDDFYNIREGANAIDAPNVAEVQLNIPINPIPVPSPVLHTTTTSEAQPVNSIVSAVAGARAIVAPIEPLKGMLTCKEQGGKNKECSRGYAEYRFKVKPRTKYYLWVRGLGPDLFANSLWIGAPGHGPLTTANCHWPEGVKVPFTVPHKHRPKHGSAKGRDKVVCCPPYLGKNRRAGKSLYYSECCHAGLGPDGHEKGCVFDLEVDPQPKWQMVPRIYHILKHHGEELAIRIYAREDGTSWTALSVNFSRSSFTNWGSLGHRPAQTLMHSSLNQVSAPLYFRS